VVETARLAGIMAAKKTSELIPLCHPLPLHHVGVEIEDVDTGFHIQAVVRSTAKTGVEMEALTAVSIAALTLYDMVKASDRRMVIEAIRLLRKSGGRSGLYVRDES
ncbi:MAG: cyclic pyranopterin monophosphate synthase MoaC, partial [Acidobacteriota bacterium]